MEWKDCCRLLAQEVGSRWVLGEEVWRYMGRGDNKTAVSLMRALTKKNLRHHVHCSFTIEQGTSFVPREYLLLTKGQKQALLDGCCFAVKGTRSISLRCVVEAYYP